MNEADVIVPASLNDDQPQSLKDLCFKSLRIIIPTDVSNMLWMSSQTITLIFVSRFHGSAGAAQYSAAITVFNMLGFSFVQGFGAAIDTISSQAYGKDRKSPVVGETLQLALVFNLALGVLISIFFINAEPLLTLLLGSKIGPGSARFLSWCPLYLLVQIISGIMSKSMFAQKVPGVVAVANLAAACTSPIANFFLTPIGLHGAALSLFVTVGCCSLTHILCCVFHPRVIVREAAWPTPQLRNADAWRRFFKVGFPSVLATCAEWWAFEFQVVFAARLGVLPLAIHGVCMNLVSLLFSIALGICVSASVMVGNSLGAMRPVQAKQYAYFIMVVDVIIAVVTAMFMLLFGSNIAGLFASKDNADYHEIIDGVRRMMPFVALCHAGDSMQFCLQGIFRGAGRPKEAGIAVLATLWVIGVPASALFVFVIKTGVAGCIGGLLVGFLFEIPVLFFWITRFNWMELALKAQHRPEESTELAIVPVDDVNEQNHQGEAGTGEDKKASAFDRCSNSGDWRMGMMEYPHSLCDEPLSPLSAEGICESSGAPEGDVDSSTPQTRGGV